MRKQLISFVQAIKILYHIKIKGGIDLNAPLRTPLSNTKSNIFQWFYLFPYISLLWVSGI